MNELKTQFEVWEDEGRELVKAALTEAKKECGRVLVELLATVKLEAGFSFEDGKGPNFKVRLDLIESPSLFEKSDWLNAIGIICEDSRGNWVSSLWGVVKILEERAKND
jgi:hypothetical protein